MSSSNNWNPRSATFYTTQDVSNHQPFCLGLNVLMDLLIVPFYNILFVYTWNDFSWLIICDYTVWIVFYDLFALSENDEIKIINQSIKSRLFTQPFLHVQIKENIKAPRRWHLSGESTRDRWIPLTKGQ